MPYHILVRCGGNGEPPREIYRKPLGADDTVFRCWYSPAYEVGLVLMAHILDGLVEQGQFLDILSQECESLQAHWQTNAELTNQVIPPSRAFREHLMDKLDFVREGIGLARARKGVLEISQRPYRVSVWCSGNDGPGAEIFCAPLGCEQTTFDYWFCPACQIGLSLLTQFYHDGLAVDNQSLNALSQDCRRLEAHWLSSNFDPWLKQRLVKRMGFVYQAIGVARQHEGVVEIS